MKPRHGNALWRFAMIVLMMMGYGHAHAEGDIQRGMNLFAQECADCHSIKLGKNKKGPSLFGILGQPAASAQGFSRYSEALKKSGVVWTPEKLDAYIANPKKAVAGGKMKYDGLDNAKDRADLISYLQSLR